RLLRFWFTFDSPVSRGAYLRHGLALMLVKYAVDAALIWAFTRLLWTPWNYLTTGAAFEHSKLAGAPKPLLSLLAIWTLPFLWIGVRCVRGASSPFVFNRRYAASQRETFEMVLVTLAAIGGVMLAFGYEGAICLLMAAPLAVGIALLGAVVGRAIAGRDSHSPA